MPVVNREGIDINEDAGMCCWVIDIKIGIILIGIICICGALGNLASATGSMYYYTEAQSTYTAVACFLDIPAIIGGVLFI